MKSDESNGADPVDDQADATVSLTKPDDSAPDEPTVVLDKGDVSKADETVEIEVDETTEVEVETVTAPEATRHWLASLALAGASAALVAALVCLGYFGYVGIRAYTVDSARDEARTAAVDGAEQAVLNTFTIDPAHMDAWQKRLPSSLTGDALKQAVDQSAQGVIKQVEEAKGRANSIKVRILSSAATEVNVDENTAKVLVLSEAVASSAPDQPTGQSYLLTMVEEDGVWKASVIVPLSPITYTDEGSTPVPGDGQEGGN